MTSLLRHLASAVRRVRWSTIALSEAFVRLQSMRTSNETFKRHCQNQILVLREDFESLKRCVDSKNLKSDANPQAMATNPTKNRTLLDFDEFASDVPFSTQITNGLQTNPIKIGETCTAQGNNRTDFSGGKFMKKIITRFKDLIIEFFLVRPKLERQLMLVGRCASWQVRQRELIQTLKDVEFRVCSQWGEDGIIDWLLENIPIKNTTFVEFGVADYQEANTRFLLQNRNWRGVIMDGSAANIEKVKKEDLYWRYDINVVQAFITRENINDLLTQNGMSGDIGLLSIDIDGNDYWVLEAISVISPRILVCEYNAVLGDVHAITIPYKPYFNRLSTHPSGQYFGASIKAVKYLVAQKGYEFVGTCSNGINSFFVRTDLFDSIAHKIKDREAFPSLHRDSNNATGRFTYIRGVARSDLIKHLPVVLVDEENREAPLESLYPLYSESWLEQIT